MASLAEIVDLERSAAGLPPPQAPKSEVPESPALVRPSEKRVSVVPAISLSGRRLSGESMAGSYPLSYNQESMWVMHRTDPSRYVTVTLAELSLLRRLMWYVKSHRCTFVGCSAAYNVAFACKINSVLDIVALRAAFQHVVERHSGLRTTFQQGRAGPVQVLPPYNQLLTAWCMHTRRD